MRPTTPRRTGAASSAVIVAGDRRASARTASSVPPALARLLRPLLAGLTDAITEEIQRTVVVFGPSSGETYLRSIRVAISQSVHYFVEQVIDPTASRTELDVTLQRIGRGEAYEGRSLQALQDAFQVGAKLAWQRIHGLALAQQLHPDVLREIGGELRLFMSSLSEQAALGYREAQAQLNDAAHEWRRRVLDLILEGRVTSEVELQNQFATGNWQVPELVSLVAVDPDPGRPLPSSRMLHPRTLARLHGSAPVVLHPAPLGGPARSELEVQFEGHRIAIGYPVPIKDAASSLRWARRALALARDGVIPDAPVIDCADHLGVLWLHAEPLLAGIVNASLLAPLLAEPPNSRRILSETLLAWIQSPRASAPALAATLGRHPQTIRYRLKRVRELFGDALDDPDRLLEMYLALRTSSALWRGET